MSRCIFLPFLLLFQVVFALHTPLACNSHLDRAVPYERWSEVIGVVSEGQDVEVPCGRKVVLDVKNLPPLGVLSVRGHLLIPHNQGLFHISAEGVTIEGKLLAGHRFRGFTNGSGAVFTMRRTGREIVVHKDDEQVRLGPSVFAVVGGQVELNGLRGGRRCLRSTWLRLAETAKRGETALRIQGDVTRCWSRGDRIVVASTSTDFREAEHATISRIYDSVNGVTTVEIHETLQHDHTGISDAYVSDGRTIEQAAEVGLLSRDLVIEGQLADLESTDGGHFVVSKTAVRQAIEGVEFRRMGQQGTLGRYSCHFHMCGSVSRSFIRGCSIHTSLQRGVVIHGTHDLAVMRNVFYDIKGHGLLLEDGVEMNNVIRFNAGFLNTGPGRRIVIDGEEESDPAPAMFWITNPNNTFSDNVASGSQFAGFWFELKKEVRGPSRDLPEARDMVPRELPLGTFADNVAHSNNDHGFRMYPDGYTPTEQAVLSRLFSWKNRFGIFAHNSHSLTFSDTVLADNRELAVDFDRVSNCRLVDSLVIGSSPVAGRTEHSAQPACPTLGAVRSSAIEFFPVHLDGNGLHNVKFDRFAACPSTALFTMFTRDGDLNDNGILQASSTLDGIRALDRRHNIVDFDTPLAEPGATRLRFMAMRVANSPAISDRDGFLVERRPLMLAPLSIAGASCASFGERTSFCTGTCVRTLRFSFRAERGRRYRLRLTRLDDNVVEETPLTPPARGTSHSLFANILSGPEYRMEILGGTVRPDYVAIMYADGPGACEGGVKLLFEHKGVMWNEQPWSEKLQRKPCPGAETSVPVDHAVWYEKCHGSVYQRVVEMPARGLTDKGEESTYINRPTNGRAIPADPCSAQVTSCVMIEPESTWRYTEAGNAPANFASPGFSDASWRSGRGDFGYNHDNVRTQLAGRHVTYYFRKEFHVDGSPACFHTDSSVVHARAGDGFILYVNGKEALRVNMNGGEVTPTTYARTHGVHWARNPYPISTVLDMLRTGRNVLAVEVHRYERSTWQVDSQSVRFDLELMLARLTSCN